MPPDEICKTLNKYSHFILQGDSISRQMMQGLLILLTSDLPLGGMRKYMGFQDNCICDGQFSEHSFCRDIVNIPIGVEMCPSPQHLPLPESKPVEISVDLQKSSCGTMLNDVNCSDPNDIGVIYAFQGGAHHGVNAENFLQARIQDTTTPTASQLHQI